MNVSDIRSTFLKYFESKGHQIVASSPVVPGDDPTLLFTNAGMNQFKDVFLGFDKRPYKRAVTAQKCIRAGGKHNDLENVGYTARHHTFFEMLGNFSFGDYFKRDAIKYAWELLTVHFKLPAEKLWATVYAEDDEAYNIWLNDIGLPKERIVRIGDNKGARYASDNFWMMGDTGPCGPCSEIFYDHGPEIPGGPPGSPDEDGDRYIEIWNNVFMQFNREVKDGPMIPLPKPSVDTGMGIERLAAVLQHVHSNYEIDLFVNLLAAAKKAVDEAGAKDCDKESPSLKVIADHIRACSFTVADGVIPGNEGRGYVLRRITRRAIRHGYKLGARAPFFHKIVAALAKEMGDAYPELRQQQARVTDVLRQEEERFFQTIANGMEILESAIAVEQVVIDDHLKQFGGKLAKWPSAVGPEGGRGNYAVMEGGKGQIVLVRETQSEDAAQELIKAKWADLVKRLGLWKEQGAFTNGTIYVVLPSKPSTKLQSWAEAQSNESAGYNFVWVDIELKERSNKVLSGELAFKLHDTYGFPLDLTADVCRERGVAVDEAGFNAAMHRQREQARAAGKFKMAQGLAYSGTATTFHGYTDLVREGAKVTAVYVDGSPVASAKAGDDVVVVLDHTPFYAESGGQVGDSGEFRNSTSRVLIDDTQKIQADVFGHHGRVVEGEVKVGDTFTARVDGELRAKTMRNHSATHLMHKALREVLGAHVQQKGSLVDAAKTRFDFAHNAPMTDDEMRRVEALVNAEILANGETQARLMPIDEAQKLGAMMLFGEKYGDVVRVLDIGTSRELCGGTHVKRAGDIGFFKIVSEGGVAAGVRRVEAITGTNAFEYVQSQSAQVARIADALKAQPQEVEAKLAQTLDNVKALEKELARLKSKLAASQGDDLASQVQAIKGVKLLATVVDGIESKQLRDLVDQLKNKLGSGVVLLGVNEGGKVNLAAGVTQDLIGKMKAGELVNFAAQQVGGKGGGRPDFAMAGGSDASKLAAAVASASGWVSERA